MSNKKLPKGAPKIPAGWGYKGVDWDSKRAVNYAIWGNGLSGWDYSTCRISTNPGGGYHYITPIKRPAKKPALAKGKAKGKPVKAVSAYGRHGIGPIHHNEGVAKYLAGFAAGEVKRFFVLPADADSVARMVEQVRAIILDAASSRADSLEMARAALSAIGVAGGKGAKK